LYDFDLTFRIANKSSNCVLETHRASRTTSETETRPRWYPHCGNQMNFRSKKLFMRLVMIVSVWSFFL